MRGDIETPWAGRAKEYSWSLCVRLAPRKISPTDIDYLVECGEKFALFEMKTEGASMSVGQQRMFAALLRRLGDSAILFVVEHTPLDRVTMPADVVRFRCVRMDGGELRASKYLDGVHFPEVYGAFFQWADGGPFKTFREVIDLAGRKALKPALPSDHTEWLVEYEAVEKSAA